MNAQIYKWKKYGVLRNKTRNDSWYARYEAATDKIPYIEEIKFFDDRKKRDQFVLEQNKLIKMYGHDDYYSLYRNLMK